MAGCNVPKPLKSSSDETGPQKMINYMNGENQGYSRNYLCSLLMLVRVTHEHKLQNKLQGKFIYLFWVRRQSKLIRELNKLVINL